ncbi:biotin-independent malonate decarboxylase subunit beta [Acinetobacter johnsonii]|jgi:malonate decarboxylase beta subunit|uniref:Biotin-independent malonate decarboxylase subunit beta n=1 Tax=Acinetobacter johnsonii TaxID=40214 RepID=A0AA42IFF2_ACIJO|nr:MULTISPECIES: biotin-independent malonate decarboxylase subunit beta [Acinetobacter]MCO8074068.1 biotin-independent malonate decarboxylase subunit beta [Acinetobacter lwoffii]MCO8077029.1 biotin-independent malonate decarboxylase subunit beta [Acinetobacter lwoffii]MDH0656582.1 biotin-independent malonate decarboxylase subunit beta [Acinetobacter johnsonii]MDH0835803.1 biotin-independent malonate decarboxylase subunit beta [Acinetobacter johnsonii]MDH0839030.1 biotin-independent malonate de
MDQMMLKNSFYEKTARARIQAVVDTQSFNEILKPTEVEVSPHLSALDIPGSFDDGVIIGTARLNGTPVHIMAQEGQFMGGAVGEIHGAKIVGLLHKAIQDQAQAVLFFVDSGGVRLHEANAGLIAISEIMRAMLQVRNAGIPIITVIGGTCGAFGGMGISACLSSTIIMTEEGRLALSGPEVIETVKGVEEFDSKDRALVWRVTGGKHRYLLNHVQALVEDDIADIRDAILTHLDAKVASLDLEQLLQQQQQLEQQYQNWFGKNDGLQIWHEMGISQPEKIPMLSAHEVVLLKQG